MATKRFVADFGTLELAISIDMDEAKEGRFRAVTSILRGSVAQLDKEKYLAWIKTVLPQVSRETGKRIGYAGRTAKNEFLWLIATPDGTVTEEWKKWVD